MGSQSHGGSSSGIVLSTVAGAVLGAAGLAWWLLSEAERRRQGPRTPRSLRISQLDDGYELEADRPTATRDLELHDKVHELNQAIDDVRRQLEGLGSR